MACRRWNVTGQQAQTKEKEEGKQTAFQKSKMKRYLKQASALLAAAVLAASSVFPAYAVDGEAETQQTSETTEASETSETTEKNLSITITGTGEKYIAYRLLKLSSQLKPGTHGSGCTASTGGNHVDDCYAYHYEVIPTYRSYLLIALNNDKLSDDEIVKAISEMKGQPEKIQSFANTVYEQIKGLEPDYYTEEETTFDNVAQGYYLIAEVKKDPEKVDTESTHVMSKVMLDTAGLESITVAAKEGTTTLTKKVVELTDSGDVKVGEDGKEVEHDYATVEMGDKVSYSLDATMPANIDVYKTYKMIFTDNLSDGLTFPGTDGFHVVIGKRDDNGAIVGELTKLKSTDYKVEIDPEDSHKATITIDNLIAAAGNVGVTVDAETLVTVYYSAEVNGIISTKQAGNSNAATLTFSNNPYVETSTGTTPEEKVYVFSFQLVVEKEDAEGNALNGAEFSLARKAEDGTLIPIGEFKYANGTYSADTNFVKKAVKNDDGTVTFTEDPRVDTSEAEFTFYGLEEGTYVLTESNAPAGYNKVDPIEFKVSPTIEVEKGQYRVVKLNAFDAKDQTIKDFTPDAKEGELRVRVINNTGIILPSTGGAGAFAIFALGTAAVVVFIFTGKKREKKQEQ